MLGDLTRRRRFTLEAMAIADALVTPTCFAQQLLERFGSALDRLVVMPCGNTTAWRSSLQPTASDFLRVGFLGNVTPIKGVHLLIAAHAKLVGLKTRLEIWGDTSLSPAYYQDLRNSSGPDVFWGGRYNREDLARILSNIDVVVVPSIWYETQGIVIQEAFAAGLPVIVSDDTSLTETVAHEKNGLHFRRGSADDLAFQIRRLIEEPGLLERLKRGVPPVRTIDEDVIQLGDIYDRLVSRKAPIAA